TPRAETARERSGRSHSKWVRSLRSNFIGGPVRCSGAAPPHPALLRCPPNPRRSPAAQPRTAPAAPPVRRSGAAPPHPALLRCPPNPPPPPPAPPPPAPPPPPPPSAGPAPPPPPPPPAPRPRMFELTSPYQPHLREVARPRLCRGHRRRFRVEARLLCRREQRALVAAEVVGEDLLDDRRGDGAAVLAGVLDDARDRDLG